MPPSALPLQNPSALSLTAGVQRDVQDRKSPRRSRSLSLVNDESSGRDSPSSVSSSLYSSETLDNKRRAVKASNNPMSLFQFSLYLLELSLNLSESENEDPTQLSSSVMTVRSLGTPQSLFGGFRNTKKKTLTPSQSLQLEAMKYIKKLAYSSVGIGKAPLPEAQYFLGEALTEGKFGCVVDHDRAFNLYFQASKQNHPESTYKAAFAYENGTGTKRDSGRALQFYRKAASLGDPFAMHRLALILQHGHLNQTKNPKEAMTWLKRAAHIAAESQYPRPLHDLAQCYEKTGGSSAVIPDEQYAFQLYTQAALLGFAPSQYRLGLCYEHGHLHCLKNAEASISWYMKAAEQDHAEAQLALSGWYLTGAEGILQQNETEAFFWALKAAEKGLAKAEYALGYYYETGTGVSVSMAQAVHWYHKAASKANKRAAKRLKEIRKLVKSGKIQTPDMKIDSRCSIM